MSNTSMSDNRAKNLAKYVIPAILTNACFFLFTIVDGIFVGRGVGSTALGAVNLALPFVMVAMAFNMLTSIGGATVTAIRFGRGDNEGANQAFMHSLTANVALAVVIMILGMSVGRPIGSLLGANEVYIDMVCEYMFWWSLFAIPMAMNINLQSFCRNDGSPLLVNVATLVSTAMNIFLDWLFVFPLQMGLTGAAIATGISQTVSMLIVLLHFILKKGNLRISRFTPQWKLYRKILYRGLPEMIAQFATSVTTMCMNNVLIRNLGEIGVNSYSIMSYVASFSLAVLVGVSEGVQPLFGQTFGAKKTKDLRFYLRSGLLISLVGSTICIIVAIFLGEPICGLFGADEATAAFTDVNMHKFAWAFIVSGVNILISAYLYSTKHSIPAIILNGVRSFVAPLLIILGLPAIFGNGIIFYTYGISESIVMIFAVILLVIMLKKEDNSFGGTGGTQVPDEQIPVSNKPSSETEISA